MLKSYRFFKTQEDWDNEVAQTAAKLKQNTGKSDLGAFALEVVANRLKKYPYAYQEFGVYWWAVKQELIEANYSFNADNVDAEMVVEYRGKTPAHTIVAAEKFSAMYRQTYFKGNKKFTLGEDDNREYVLYDEEMETQIP